jgi:hypothetical protein
LAEVKKMKNKIVLGLAMVFAISVLSLGILAYKVNPGAKGPNYNEDVHEQLESAMERGDYHGWLSIRQANGLPTNGRMFQIINEENFDKYVALHNANLAGDTETAFAIKAELGLGQGSRKGQVMRSESQGMGSGQGGKTGCGGTCPSYVDADGDGACDNRRQ